MFIVAEWELRIPYLWKTNDGFLSSFLPRGFSFTFVAVIGVMQGTADEGVEEMKRIRAAPETMPGSSFFLALLIQLSSWMLMIAGLLYIVLGAFCLQNVRDQCRLDYQAAVKKFMEDTKAEIEKEKQALQRQHACSCDFGNVDVPSQPGVVASCDFGV